MRWVAGQQWNVDELRRLVTAQKPAGPEYDGLL